MNVMRFTSKRVASALLAGLVMMGCEDNTKSNSPPGAGEASTAASSPEASSAASAGSDAYPAASATSSADTLADEDDTLAAEEVLDHYRYHHGGITNFIAMSLDTLGVSPERQDAVESIQYELDSRMAPLHDAERNLLEKLADGVSAGTVDAVKVDADLGQVARAVGTVRGASADLINRLHASLTLVERAALVDKVQAHWQVWRDANSERIPGAGSRESGRLARLTRELGLTPDQVARIQVGLEANAGSLSGPIEPKLASDVDARLSKFSNAFVSESFDAKTLGEWEVDDSHLAAAGMTRMAHLCRAAAPVLTPEQRTTFASHLREHRFQLAVGK